jgi:predicted AAA+ superfamily ATPase
MDRLKLQFQSLLDRIDTSFLRYLHNDINWSNRLIAILGARGTGKTTLLLQYIKLNLDFEKTLFVNADDFYFSSNKLFDLAEEFSIYGGKHFFIDEIHKYPDWSREIKLMYDYLPELQVVFTGSSILDIFRGQADLSRRVINYHLHGLSFREFINLKLKKNYPVYLLEEILKNNVEIAEKPLPLFKEYIQSGYYPFFIEGDYVARLKNILKQTIEIDIPIHTGMISSNAQKLKHLLFIVAESVPFKPNLTKIGAQLGVHRNQVADYLVHLEKAGLVQRIFEKKSGIRALGKIQKLYLNNPNMTAALDAANSNIGNIRETVFVNQMFFRKLYASKIADFETDEYVFEIGGKNKAQKQIQGVRDAFLVKDDIEKGIGNIVPLWMFGFQY